MGRIFILVAALRFPLLLLTPADFFFHFATPPQGIDAADGSRLTRARYAEVGTMARQSSGASSV